MNHRNLAGLVDDLNPEAKQLLDDISTSSQANHSEKPLGLLLGGVTEPPPSVQPQVKPIQSSPLSLIYRQSL
ncbi:MAG TPA: hypothetical protein VGQ08_19340 [Nitrospiraceae bacterium]|nr:hypothetical protein [Nitrospiraceae bacterium]